MFLPGCSCGKESANGKGMGIYTAEYAVLFERNFAWGMPAQVDRIVKLCFELGLGENVIMKVFHMLPPIA